MKNISRIFKLFTIFVAASLLFACGGGGGGSSTTPPAAVTTHYFSSTNGVDGYELWKTNGSAAGTVMVKDINENTAASSNPSNVIEVNGVKVFAADDGTNGLELWTTDGTADGTYMLKNIHLSGSGIGYGFGRDSGSAIIGNELYFQGGDADFGNELWKTDGTADGTVRVTDIYSGAANSSPGWLTAYKNKLYFRASDGSPSAKLYRYDPADGSVTMLKDINQVNYSSIQTFQVSFDHLYFGAVDPTAGAELWRTDGTTSGTVVLTDLVSGYGSSYVQGLTHTSLGMFFSATDVAGGGNSELYRVPNGGTPYKVKEISPSSGGLYFNNSAGTTVFCDPVFVEMNNYVYFYANNDTNGFELWRTDGTAANTTMVKDINPDAAGSCMGRNYQMLTIGNTLYFQAQSSASNVELWKSDGTASGTVMVKDINASGSSSISGMRVSGNILYFNANDGVNGKELWRSDGTATGTYMVKDINVGTGSSR